MNQLNSILIEGTVVGDPEVSDMTDTMATCFFFIESIHRRGEKNTVFEEVSRIEIETFGRLGLSAAKKLKTGRGVRIVGRIRQDVEDFDGKDISRVWIVAEHIEFKPDAKDSKFLEREEENEF